MIGALLQKITEALSQPWRYARHAGTVVLQHADDSVDVVPDDATLQANGLSSLPIKHGLPGVRVRVPQGARVLFGWDGGDLQKPYVSLWDPGSIDQLILGAASLNGGSGQPVARVGDLCRVTWPTLNIVGGTLNGQPFAATIAIGTPTIGVIQTGEPSVLA